MPPRKKITDEDKKEMFQKWQESDEWAVHLERYRAAREKIKKYELATVDVTEDWTEYLNSIWALLPAFKIPKKSKRNSFINHARV